MSILDEIKGALGAIDDDVYYGTALSRNPNAPWNYTVFFRASTDLTGNKTGYRDAFQVAVVREGYIPEDMLQKVIDAMSGIAGMRLSDSQGVEYVYDVKPKTTQTVEMMVLQFCHARKK